MKCYTVEIGDNQDENIVFVFDESSLQPKYKALVLQKDLAAYKKQLESNGYEYRFMI